MLVQTSVIRDTCCVIRGKHAACITVTNMDEYFVRVS